MAKAKVAKPSRSQYELTSESGKKAHLTRVTTMLDWVYGEAKGGMGYWGAQQALKWALEGTHMDETGLYFDGEPMESWRLFEDLYASFKKSDFDPNRHMRMRGAEGSKAHKLFQYLCQGVAGLQSKAPPWKVGYINERWIEAEGLSEDDGLTVEVPEDFLATKYDAGACAAYHELFQHLNAHELLNEERVYWTEHPIDECEDEICTHGVAGTLDTVLPLHGHMFDVKTHKPPERFSDFAQQSLYSMCWEQMHPELPPITQQAVLMFLPDGTYYLADDPQRFVPPSFAPTIIDAYQQRRAWGPKSLTWKDPEEETDEESTTESE